MVFTHSKAIAIKLDSLKVLMRALMNRPSMCVLCVCVCVCLWLFVSVPDPHRALALAAPLCSMLQSQQAETESISNAGCSLQTCSGEDGPYGRSRPHKVTLSHHVSQTPPPPRALIFLFSTLALWCPWHVSITLTSSRRHA